MKTRKKSNRKMSLAPMVKWRVANDVLPEELENSKPVDLKLVFSRKSPVYEILSILQHEFIQELEALPIPEGFIPPIAAGEKRSKTSHRNVETLLANLFSMNIRGNKTLAISLSPNTYSNTKLNAGFINLVKLASHKSRRFLILKRGFRNLRYSRLARIKPAPRFWELMDTALVSEDDIISEPHDLINLRKRKTKEIIPRKQWEKTITREQKELLHAIRMSLEWFNLVIGEYEITYTKTSDGKKHYLYPTLYAVYTGDFDHNGRFYTGKGGHQSLTKTERKTIRFNGHSTIELDYSGLHIRLLYHLSGLDYPLDKDPYAVVLEAIGMNPKVIFQKYPSIRDDLKTTLLALINGTIKSKKYWHSTATRRAHYRLFEKWRKIKNPRLQKEEKLQCQKRRKIWHKVGLLDSQGKPSKIIKGFEKAHEPIKNNFSTGAGLAMQNLDATIARWIMFEMMVSESDCCIPVLPIHDSFVTFKACKNKLKTVMESTYQKILQQQTKDNKTFRIPIKSP